MQKIGIPIIIKTTSQRNWNQLKTGIPIHLESGVDFIDGNNHDFIFNKIFTYKGIFWYFLNSAWS